MAAQPGTMRLRGPSWEKLWRTAEKRRRRQGGGRSGLFAYTSPANPSSRRNKFMQILGLVEDEIRGKQKPSELDSFAGTRQKKKTKNCWFLSLSLLLCRTPWIWRAGLCGCQSSKTRCWEDLAPQLRNWIYQVASNLGSCLGDFSLSPVDYISL